MRYRSILLVLALVILVSTGCWSPLLADKRYEITGASIDAEVSPDGGLLIRESRTESDGSITAFCDNLPAHEYLELRALYPPQLFTGLFVTERRITETVMQEEAEWAEKANRRRQRRIEK